MRYDLHDDNAAFTSHKIQKWKWCFNTKNFVWKARSFGPSRDLPFHPSIFEKNNGSEVKRAAMKTNGSHSPSGLDAGEWRRLLTSYKSSSIDLRKTLSKLAIRIATEEPIFLNSYNACLIALDKCPGFRRIGIEEVLRRIIGRSKVKCVKRYLQLPWGKPTDVPWTKEWHRTCYPCTPAAISWRSYWRDPTDWYQERV